MTDGGFRVDGIDHVELSVPDRYDAAEWYNEALGFEIVEEFEHWAKLSAYPLMISTDGGRSMLALFEGTPLSGRGGFQRVAFRTSGENFLAFLDRADAISELDVRGTGSIMDFGSAYSVFFSDPYGYAFEVTTYEYDMVSERID